MRVVVGLPIAHIFIDAQRTKRLQVILPFLFRDAIHNGMRFELIQIVIDIRQQHVAFGFFLCIRNNSAAAQE